MDFGKIISTAALKAAIAIVLTRGVETRVRMADLAANLKSCISDRVEGEVVVVEAST